MANGSYAVLNRHKGDWYPGEIPCNEALVWVHLPKPPEMVPVIRGAPRKRATGPEKRSKTRAPKGPAGDKAAKRKHRRPS